MQVKGLQGDLQGLAQDESTKQKSGHHDTNYGEDGREYNVSNRDLMNDVRRRMENDMPIGMCENQNVLNNVSKELARCHIIIHFIR